MSKVMSRRNVLASSAAWIACPVLADAPSTSLRPRSRPAAAAPRPDVRPRARPTSGDLITNAGLGGTVGFVIADAATGEVLEAVDGDAALPPASVTKAITALYGLEALGADYQFETNVYATGAVIDDVLNGDLILAGGGDPTLQTDDLASLADALLSTGLKGVNGRFLVWDGALQKVDEIDPVQLDHLGYNPSISGINLNFNRVHFEWKQESGDSYAVSMEARSAAHQIAVTTARMLIVDRGAPVYTYEDKGDVDAWTVARRALGDGGSRWLPVRYPALYAGEVFQTFLRSGGLVVPSAERTSERPAGTVLAQHKSAPLADVMRGMLKFSTNLTAEATGMTASAKRAGARRGLRTSALAMQRWTTERAGIAPEFVDHSGLGDAARVTARDMVALLTAPGARASLYPLMTTIRMVDQSRAEIPNFPGAVVAKTGTLNFVTTLAGYLTTAGGRELAFAIFAGDLEAREAGKRIPDEQPPGARTYNARAKNLQQALLQRWITTWGDQPKPEEFAQATDET